MQRTRVAHVAREWAGEAGDGDQGFDADHLAALRALERRVRVYADVLGLLRAIKAKR